MDTTGKVINCTAAVAWDAGDQLTVEEIEVDPPKTGEVRVRIIATGVCQIDSYTLSGRNPDALYPVILGHEGAGVVESVGLGVTTVKPGDHVIPLSVPQCKTCKFCLNPKTNLCPTASSTQIRGVMPDGTTRFRCRGNMVYHFMGCSTFSEYTVVLEISLCKISKAAPLDRVCLLACSVPIGYGAALNTAKVEPSSNCAIFGLGAIGLAVALGCKAAGAKRIIGVDVDPKKHEIAKRFGVNEFINPLDYSKPLHQVLINKTDGGLDYTFECSGDVKTMRTALESCHKGWGVSVVLAVATAKDEIKTLPFQLVMGRTWKGAAFGGYKSRDGIPKLVDEYMDNKLPLDNFVTHDLPLEDISEAFHLMHCGKSIRSVVHMSRALRPHYACCKEISGHYFQYSKHG